jgi:hypothetical protein
MALFYNSFKIAMYQKLIVTTASVVVAFTAGISSSLAASFTLTQSFFNPNPNKPDQFSAAFASEVAIDEEKVLIGARFADTFGNGSGAAYLFNAVTGDLSYSFSYPNLGAGQNFGTDVAIDRNKVLVGTSYNGAYLFDTTSGNLIQSFSRFNSDLNTFGTQVAINNNKVLISDLQNSTLAPVSGAAFLFDAVNGNLTQSFFPPNPDIEDFFGSPVAIEGNRVLIGATGGGRGRNSTGEVFLFDAVNGNLIQNFFPPNPNIKGFFGSSVAIEGNRVLIGASGDDTFGSNSGAAYLFDATSGSLMQTFSSPNPIGSEFFGSSVAIDGDKVLIGARGDNTFGDNSGAAFLFDAVSGNLIQSFFAPNPGNNNNFGFSVAISGNNLLIGAPGSGNDGAAFLFQPASTSVPEPSNVVGLSVLILGLLKKRKNFCSYLLK